MSRLYGVNSHAEICRILKTYNTRPFCECCRNKQQLHDDATPENSRKKKRKRRTVKKSTIDATKTMENFSEIILEFLQSHHLSVHAVEKRIAYNGITGRVDCIFQDNMNPKKLFIVDWKFSNYIPLHIQMDYMIQLNIYMYILKRTRMYASYTFELYCFIVPSSSNSKQTKIFKCNHLPDTFIENLITKTQFGLG